MENNSSSTKSDYRNRINKAIDFMQANLHAPPSLDGLAEIAGFSPYHFHRIFKGIVGESVIAHANRLRLEKAVRMLKHTDLKLSKIASESGYESSSSFSRAFSESYGLSPREFRRSKTFKDSKIRQVFPIDMEYIASDKGFDELITKFPVAIKNIDFGRVAYIRSWNSYSDDRCLKAFGRLKNWADENGNYRKDSCFFGMSLDDPEVTPKEQCRYESCLTVSEAASSAGEIEVIQFPKMQLATTRIFGDLNLCTEAYAFLFSSWLPRSGYDPEHCPAIEIFLDRQKVLDWSHFSLELGIPVKRKG
jgi:AraC family transcriptional regulator